MALRPNSNSELGRLLNEMLDRLDRLEAMHAPGALVDKTTMGTFIRPSQWDLVTKGGEGSLKEIRQWDSTKEYKKNDLAFADSLEERETGLQAGLYQATENVTGGAHPSASVSWVLVGRAHWDRLKFKSNFGTGEIIVAAAQTAEDLTNHPMTLVWYGAEAGESAGCFKLFLGDIPSNVPEGQARILKARVYDICVSENGTTVPKKVLLLGGEPYEPPA